MLCIRQDWEKHLKKKKGGTKTGGENGGWGQGKLVVASGQKGGVAQEKGQKTLKMDT